MPRQAREVEVHVTTLGVAWPGTAMERRAGRHRLFTEGP
jgi:hypothetical protein